MLKIKSLFTLILSLFTLAVFAGETAKISQQELLTALDKGAENLVVLDVRSEGEYQHGHIAGAINISHDKVEESLSQLTQYKNSTVVVYCRSGRRAGIAEAILAKNGFSDLRHLTGDMNGWVAAKLPVDSNAHSH
ncbi:MAG: rhodanese-like domain-containing protein [Colwellia sp.]|nr:rhodanese-like domain-containing protein [Colwellia sp.]MCW8863329.1 rhodanese-like domain-containing protein [Colwellia sp.]MCW9080943.1 rhodanese-like domain-containing protein [Colwellia sp.]